MKPLVVAVHAVLGVALATGCTSLGLPAPQVVPVVSVQHGAPQADGYYQLARHLRAQGRIPEAIAGYGKAVGLDAQLADAHDELGTLYATVGELDKAIASFAAAIAVDASIARYHNNLGYALLLQHRYAEAAAACERALALDVASRRAWNNLGLARAGQGDTVGAQDAYARATALEATATANMPDVGGATVVDAAPAAPATTNAADAARPRSALVRLAPNVYELRAMAPAVPATAAVAEASPSSWPAFRLEVANGNGIQGLARRVGSLLADEGFPRARLTNQKPFAQRQSEIQYREGYRAAALAVRDRLPDPPPVAASARLRADTDVRLVLGRDVGRDVALVPKPAPAVHLSGMALQDVE